MTNGFSLPELFDQCKGIRCHRMAQKRHRTALGHNEKTII